MARLLAKSVLDELLPLETGPFRLIDASPARITSIEPFRGRDGEVSKALGAAYGVEFPPPDRSHSAGGMRVLWAGQGQAFLVGDAPVDGRLSEAAALTDQSDGWAVMRLQGVGAQEVLARLTPTDLRPRVFAEGDVARAPLGHMLSVIARVAGGIEVMVFRSMARNAVHEIGEAMASVAAERRLGAGPSG